MVPYTTIRHKDKHLKPILKISVFFKKKSVMILYNSNLTNILFLSNGENKFNVPIIASSPIQLRILLIS